MDKTNEQGEDDKIYEYFEVSLCCRKCREEFTDIDEAKLHIETCENNEQGEDDKIYEYFEVSLCCRKCREEFTDIDEAKLHIETCENNE